MDGDKHGRHGMCNAPWMASSLVPAIPTLDVAIRTLKGGSIHLHEGDLRVSYQYFLMHEDHCAIYGQLHFGAIVMASSC